MLLHILISWNLAEASAKLLLWPSSTASYHSPTFNLLRSTVHLKTKTLANTVFIPLPAVRCTSITKIQELGKAVAEIGDWETLCENLEVPSAVINELHFSNSKIERKKAVCLEVYFNSGKACWEQVVKTVADSPFYNKRLARQIAATHGIKDEL